MSSPEPAPAVVSLHALRRPARQRVWTLLLALALVFGALLHAGHVHDGTSPKPHHACATCLAQDRSGGAPPPHVPALAAPVQAAGDAARATLYVAHAAAPIRTPRCPRAPPDLHA